MKFSNTELMTMAIGAGDKARYLSPPNPWVGRWSSPWSPARTWDAPDPASRRSSKRACRE